MELNGFLFLVIRCYTSLKSSILLQRGSPQMPLFVKIVTLLCGFFVITQNSCLFVIVMLVDVSVNKSLFSCTEHKGWYAKAKLSKGPTTLPSLKLHFEVTPG